MASTKPEAQITWSGASSVTVDSAAQVVSDEFPFNVEDWDGEVEVSVDNLGTPSSGDVCNVSLLYTTGDILEDSGNDYTTPDHAEWIMQIDTYSEDPARKTAFIRTAPTAFKLAVDCPNAATRNMVVRARLVTHRPQ